MEVRLLVTQLVRVRASYLNPIYTRLAQIVERLVEAQKVVGARHTPSTTYVPLA